MSVENINSSDDFVNDNFVTADRKKEVDVLSDDKLHLSSVNKSQGNIKNVFTDNDNEERANAKDDNDPDRVVPFYPTSSGNPLKSKPNDQLTLQRNVNEIDKSTSVVKENKNVTSTSSSSSSPRKSIKTREEKEIKQDEEESYQEEQDQEEMEYSDEDNNEDSSSSENSSELSAHFDPTVMREGILRHCDQKAHSRRHKGNKTHHRHHWSRQHLTELNQLPQSYLNCGPSCSSNDSNYSTEQLISVTNSNRNNYNSHALPPLVPSSAPLTISNNNNTVATHFNVESDRDNSSVEYIAFSLPSGAVQLTTIPFQTISPQRVNLPSYNTPIAMIPLTSLPPSQPFPSWSESWSSETEREVNTFPMIFSHHNEVLPNNAVRPFYPHIIPFQTAFPANNNNANNSESGVNTTGHVNERMSNNNRSDGNGINEMNRHVMTSDPQREENSETNTHEVERAFPFTTNTNTNTTLPYFLQPQSQPEQEEEEYEQEQQKQHEEEQDDYFSDDSSGIGECTLFNNFCRSCEEDIKAASTNAFNDACDAKIAKMVQLESRMTDSRCVNEQTCENEQCNQHLLSCRHSLPTPPVIPSPAVRGPRLTRFQRHTISYDNQHPENVFNSHLCGNDEADATHVGVTPIMAWTERDHVPEWVTSMATAANSNANVNTDNNNNNIIDVTNIDNYNRSSNNNGRNSLILNNTGVSQSIPQESLLEDDTQQSYSNIPLEDVSSQSKVKLESDRAKYCNLRLTSQTNLLPLQPLQEQKQEELIITIW